MPTNVDPFLKTPQQVGALAGYSDGMRMSYGLADLDRQFRESDLENQRKQNLYNNEMLDNPLKEVDRQTKINAGDLSNEMYDNGSMRTRFNDETSVGSAKAEKGLLENKSERIIQAADALQKAATLFSNPNLGNAAAWNDTREELKAGGVKDSSLPIQMNSAQSIAQLQALAQAAGTTAASMRARADARAKIQAEEDITHSKDRAARIRVAEIQGENGLEKAANAGGNPLNAAVQRTIVKINKNGGVATADDIISIKANLSKTDTEEINKAAEGYRVPIATAQGKQEDFDAIVKELKLEGRGFTRGTHNAIIAKAAAEQQVDINNTKDAYGRAISPKLTEADAKQLFGNDPEFLNLLRKHDKILGNEPTKSQVSTPKATSAANTTTNKSLISFEELVKLNPNVPVETLRKAYEDKQKNLGVTQPVSTKVVEPSKPSEPLFKRENLDKPIGSALEDLMKAIQENIKNEPRAEVPARKGYWTSDKKPNVASSRYRLNNNQ